MTPRQTALAIAVSFVLAAGASAQEEVIRDFHGQPIGKLKTRGDRTEAFDFFGAPLGTADRTGTRDFLGRPISPNNVPGLLFSPAHNPMLKENAAQRHGDTVEQSTARIEAGNRAWRQEVEAESLRSREADGRRADELSREVLDAIHRNQGRRKARLKAAEKERSHPQVREVPPKEPSAWSAFLTMLTRLFRRESSP